MNEPLLQDRSEMNVIFIHSALDDYGLTAAEFRVYAHLSRRAGSGTGYPGIDSMAKICCLSKPTVITAIRRLETIGMLKVERIDGKRNRYRLTKKSAWEPARLKTGNGETGQNEGTDQAKIGNATGQNDGTEGNPSEGNPIKTSRAVPADLFGKNPQMTGRPQPMQEITFRELWEQFRLHRKKIKAPMTDYAEELILRTLAERPEDSVAGLTMALKKGWKSFEWEWFDKAKRAEKNGAAPAKTDYEAMRADPSKAV